MADARMGLGKETKNLGVVTVFKYVGDKSLGVGECNALVKKSKV